MYLPTIQALLDLRRKSPMPDGTFYDGASGTFYDGQIYFPSPATSFHLSPVASTAC